MTNAWTGKASMPTARACLSTSVVNGKIYAMGGTLSSPWSQATAIVEEYDPAADVWTRKSDMPTPRSYFATGVVNGRIYAIGGFASDYVPLSQVDQYDPETDTWSGAENMLTPRWGLTASVANGRIYAMGGRTAQGSISSKVEAYTVNQPISMGLHCKVTEEGALSVSLSLDPADGDCDTIELFIDDTLVQTVAPPVESPITLDLPQDCRPGLEYTLKAVSAESGLTETCTFRCPGTRFRRGDVNADGQIDVSDPIYTLVYLFNDGPDPVCMDSADANDDENIDLSDPLSILRYQFSDDTPPAEPFEACGYDPASEDEGGLDCAEFTPCY
jgi:hypothetical protein